MEISFWQGRGMFSRALIRISGYRPVRAAAPLLLSMMVFSAALPAAVYHYVDDQGHKVFVDSARKIPAQYRDQLTTIAEEGEALSEQQKHALEQRRQSAQQNLQAERRLRKLQAARAKMQSPVTLRGNQVIVPVRLVWRGRVANVHLLLDTGASITVIHRDAVASLKPSSRSSSYARVAGGGTIQTDNVIFDRLEFGPYQLNSKSTAVIDNQQSAGFDGLLGMDVVGRIRYEINFQDSTVTWDPQRYEQLGEQIEAFKAAAEPAAAASLSGQVR